MVPLFELERAYADLRRAIAEFQAELQSLLHEFCRAAHAAAFCRRRLTETMRRSANLHQARRFAAHRLAQNQQLPGPGTARGANGQDAHDCGNRRGAAWRGHRHRLRRMLGLECVVYMGTEDMERQALNVSRMRMLGARSCWRGFGQPHAERCDQRSHARLGHQRSRPRITCWARYSARIRIRRWCAIFIR